MLNPFSRRRKAPAAPAAASTTATSPQGAHRFVAVLDDETALALRAIAVRHGTNITEATMRAIATELHLQQLRDSGHTIVAAPKRRPPLEITFPE